jgi:hypothetical protein
MDDGVSCSASPRSGNNAGGELSALPLDPIRPCAADPAALPPDTPTGGICPGTAEGGRVLVWTELSPGGATWDATELLDAGAAISASATSTFL